MNAGNIFLALEPVIQAFDTLGIGYHIAGSIASSAYGIARATLDVDLVANLKENQIRPLVDCLSNGYYIDEDRVRDAVVRRSSFNLIHLESMLKVDVFILKARRYDQVAFARARLENLGEGTAIQRHYIATPEDVILNKLDWYRQGSCISERQWSDVVGILKVQQSALDMEYLRRWAATLALTDLFLRALADSGMESLAGPAGDDRGGSTSS